MHFYSEHDIVQNTLASLVSKKFATRTYENPETVNVKVLDESVKRAANANVNSPGLYIEPLPTADFGPVESHSLQHRPELLVMPEDDQNGK